MTILMLTNLVAYCGRLVQVSGIGHIVPYYRWENEI